MLKKALDAMLDALVRLSAAVWIMVERFRSMLVAVSLILTVVIIGTHVILYQVKSLKCEQMRLPKTKMDRTVSDFRDSCDSVALRLEKRFKTKTEWDE